MNRSAASLCVAAAVWFAAPPVFGQTARGFAVDRFDPSERGSEWFAADSLDFRGNLRPALGVVGSWSHDPLVLYNSDGSKRSVLLADQIQAHVGGSLVLLDRLRLSINLPIALYENGSGGTLDGTTYQVPSSPAVGDLRLSADVRLFGVFDDPFTLAVGASLYLPTGSTSGFDGDGSTRLSGRVLGAGRIGPFVYAGQVAIEFRGRDDSFGGTDLGSELHFGASAGAKIVDDRLVVGPEIFGSTVVTSTAFQKTNTPLEGLLGAHYQVADAFRIGAGVGAGLTRGLGAPEERVLASIEWVPPPPAHDRDHDGVLDDVDACPDVAGVRTDDPKTNGCPPPPPDRDRDGVTDGDDACPDVAGVRTDDPKTNGCPPPPPDRDGDAVLDADDACPDVAGVKTDDPKTNGCPADRDHDAVPDASDACPDVAGVKTDDPKTNGCPADTDGDGVLDTEDACPKEPGARDPDPKRNGCPRAILRQGKIRILDQVKFRTGSAQLDPASDPLLEAVRAVMTDHPELKKIRVEGHTDNRGGAAANKKLSDARAASVVAWLVKHGVDSARLVSEGFGQTQPLDSNRTDDGRRNNRRVEFTVVDGAPAEPAAP